MVGFWFYKNILGKFDNMSLLHKQGSDCLQHTLSHCSMLYLSLLYAVLWSKIYTFRVRNYSNRTFWQKYQIIFPDSLIYNSKLFNQEREAELGPTVNRTLTCTSLSMWHDSLHTPTLISVVIQTSCLWQDMDPLDFLCCLMEREVIFFNYLR